MQKKPLSDSSFQEAHNAVKHILNEDETPKVNQLLFVSMAKDLNEEASSSSSISGEASPC